MTVFIVIGINPLTSTKARLGVFTDVKSAMNWVDTDRSHLNFQCTASRRLTTRSTG